MGSHARSDRTRAAWLRRAAALLAVVVGVGGCHIGELLSSPNAPGDDASPETPGPVGAAALAIAAGNDQRDTVGAVLAAPYVVRVSDASARPMSGVTVRWTVAAGNGTLNTAQSVTDASGLARATHTLGTSVGTHTVNASVTGLSTVRSFTAVARHGAPYEIDYEAGPANSVMGEPISPAIRLVLRDRHGNLADGVAGSGAIAIVSGTGTPLAELSGTLAEAILNGRMQFDDVRVSLVGLGYRLRVSFAGLAAQSAPFDVALIGLP